MAQDNMRKLSPKGQGANPQQTPAQQTTPQAQPQTAVTPKSDPGILKLVKNNDLNVATISREANRKNDDSSQDEVVISLR